MNIDEIPRGQLSTIILMTLSETDKYGYEIIDEVLKKTNGKISIKQPSLYSSLKRMEDQKIISSYWRDSDIGGRRHYYHLTDLGKKHLEKWKNDLPFSFNQDIQNNNTKVLQQENIFNINKNIETDKTINDVPKKEDSFVQFDLFSNSTIVTPPTKDQDNNLENLKKIDDENLSKQNINSLDVSTNSNIHSFEYVKKVNKSFSDSFNDNQSYDKKYIESISTSEKNINENDNIKVEDFEENKQENLTNNQQSSISIKDLDNYPTNNTLQQNIINENSFVNGVEETHEDIIQNATLTSEMPKEQITEKKDDGVLITERLNIEDMPKPTKWESHKFEVYISGNNIAPDLKRQKSKNYEDRVKDLYEQSKANAENQELELIDNKIKFATYKDLKLFYEEQKIKFKPFVKSLKNTSKDYNMIKITKLNMLSSLPIFIYIAILSLCFGIICSDMQNIKLNHPISFIICPFIACLYFIYYLILFLKAPQKKIALDLTKYKVKIKYLIVSLLLIPIILAINIMIGFSFVNFKTYIVTALYPIFITLSYLIFCLSRKLILKTKFIY